MHTTKSRARTVEFTPIENIDESKVVLCYEVAEYLQAGWLWVVILDATPCAACRDVKAFAHLQLVNMGEILVRDHDVLFWGGRMGGWEKIMRRK